MVRSVQGEDHLPVYSVTLSGADTPFLFAEGEEKTPKPTVIYLLPDKDCKEIQEEHPSTKA